MDFTLKTYKIFLTTLVNQGFLFSFLSSQMQQGKGKQILLRHDVDRLPFNSLEFARIESSLGILGSYFFRYASGKKDAEIIQRIADLGHDVGYHYEDMDLMAQRYKGITEEQLVMDAIKSFEINLEKLRRLVPVKTICMHGSPMSRWDSRLLWKYYDYRNFGIEAEPYFDFNMEEMLYLTDTGRRWNGSKFSVRDKAHDSESRVQSAELNLQEENVFSEWIRQPIPGSLMNMTKKALEFQVNNNYRSTIDIIRDAKKGELPNKIMMTFHPQRWSDKPLPWVKELLWQNTKNMGKYALIRFSKK